MARPGDRSRGARAGCLPWPPGYPQRGGLGKMTAGASQRREAWKLPYTFISHELATFLCLLLMATFFTAVRSPRHRERPSTKDQPEPRAHTKVHFIRPTSNFPSKKRKNCCSGKSKKETTSSTWHNHSKTTPVPLIYPYLTVVFT